MEKQTETTDELSSVPLSVWLDALEEERRALIMRLRQIERNLMAHGRLRAAWTTAAQEPASPLTGRKTRTDR